jgi:hypothetical protein
VRNWYRYVVVYLYLNELTDSAWFPLATDRIVNRGAEAAVVVGGGDGDGALGFGIGSSGEETSVAGHGLGVGRGLGVLAVGVLFLEAPDTGPVACDGDAGARASKLYVCSRVLMISNLQKCSLTSRRERRERDQSSDPHVINDPGADTHG